MAGLAVAAVLLGSGTSAMSEMSGARGWMRMNRLDWLYLWFLQVGKGFIGLYSIFVKQRGIT
uniref:Uncharacterized protein n=1 Tax=Hyaloperonospora arabidopsidis (strain Emoy2) TaxID=559515 RepID=M4BDI4_HYAAE